MNEHEMKSLLTGANAIDPRVQVNLPTAGLWSRRLSVYTFAEAWAALEIYYDRHVDFRPPVDPPALRKIIHDESTRALAKQNALTAGPVVVDPHSFRERNPELWDQLFEEGVRQGNADRQRRTERRNSHA